MKQSGYLKKVKAPFESRSTTVKKIHHGYSNEDVARCGTAKSGTGHPLRMKVFRDNHHEEELALKRTVNSGYLANSFSVNLLGWTGASTQNLTIDDK